MKLSIITVCYNAEASIERCINSVLSQTYTNIEYIIIDGGSIDTTLAIIQKYAGKISIIRSEKDNGIYDALNKGIALATGTVIGILHSDDQFYANNTLALVASHFSAKPNLMALYGDLIYVNENRTIRYWKSGNYAHKKFRNGWMPPHPTFFAKKEAFDKYGVYNTGFKFSADYELMLRMLYVHKISVQYLPKILVKMQVGGLSNKNLMNRVNANFEDKKAWKVNKLKHPFYTLYLKPILKINQFYWWSRS